MGSGRSDETDPYISYDQARDMLALALRLPIGHGVVGGCGIKTNVILGAMLREGVPEGALRRLGNFIPDFSPQGLLRAYSTGDVMNVEQDFDPNSFVARVRLSVDPIVSEDPLTVVHQDAEFSSFKELGVPSTLIRRVGIGDGRQWGIRETKFPAHFANHFCAAVRVHNPNSGRVETMALDPGHDRDNPISVAEWKRRQKCESSVVTIARIGEGHRLEIGLMDQQRKMDLGRLLGAGGASDARLIEAVSLASGEDYRRIVKSFLNLEGGQAEAFAPKTEEEFFYAKYSANFVSYFSRNKFLSADSLAAKLENNVEILKPLQVYENWLRSTDALLRGDKLPVGILLSSRRATSPMRPRSSPRPAAGRGSRNSRP
ncbi:MAG: hypothetical protein M0026_04480 [Nocardiopsaceae bacterium]|nr:hypothetical protein [Nocardiopsaceae bacterium]